MQLREPSPLFYYFQINYILTQLYQNCPSCFCWPHSLSSANYAQIVFLLPVGASTNMFSSILYKPSSVCVCISLQHLDAVGVHRLEFLVVQGGKEKRHEVMEGCWRSARRRWVAWSPPCHKNEPVEFQMCTLMFTAAFSITGIGRPIAFSNLSSR